MRLLIVEDDPETALAIGAAVRAMGAEAVIQGNGEDGLRQALDPHFDALIVDRMLPRLSGQALVERLRAAGIRTPVLMLTALGGLDDRVSGLESGADDYLVKPFDPPELQARIKALVRRAGLAGGQGILRVGDLRLDLPARTAWRGEVRLDLQPREFDLLLLLARNAGETVTRTMLLEQIWGFHFDPRTSIVETHISRLRAKVDKPFNQPLIHTARGEGYRLDDSEEA